MISTPQKRHKLIIRIPFIPCTDHPKLDVSSFIYSPSLSTVWLPLTSRHGTINILFQHSPTTDEFFLTYPSRAKRGISTNAKVLLSLSVSHLKFFHYPLKNTFPSIRPAFSGWQIKVSRYAPTMTWILIFLPLRHFFSLLSCWNLFSASSRGSERVDE